MRIAQAWVVSMVSLTACTISTGDAEPDLVLTRADGSRIVLPPNTETRAYCEPADPYSPASIHIFHGNPLGGSSWDIRAVLSSIALGNTVTFPAADAIVFVDDDEDDNSVSSDHAGSRGTITFESADCYGFVDLTVRASLESDDGPSITVQGSFRSPVGSCPD